MKMNLNAKCTSYDFEKLFKDKGYVWFNKGDYNLNIIGIRSNKERKLTNLYDDLMVVDYTTANGHKRVIYTITTEPGRPSLLKPINPKGAAILVPDQYRGCWEIGLHKGKYKALIQKKPVKVYRDNNKDEVFDLEPKTIENGVFGINIHRSNEMFTRNTVDNYSAGCQVFNNPISYIAFMRLCEEQSKRYGNSFTYTLINEEDL